MGHSCLHTHARLPEIDPTRTATVRRRFSGAARRRFRAVRGLIRDALIAKQALGQTGGEPATNARMTWNQGQPARPGQFAFEQDPMKVSAFVEWLRRQLDAEVLGVTDLNGVEGQDIWAARFIESGYRQGMQRARQEVNRAGIASLDTSSEAITASFDHPIHRDRVMNVYTRVFENLRDINQAVADDIRSVLAQGLADGKNPRELARILSGRVAAVGENRARIMARTEVVRAHHLGNIGTFREVGIPQATVQAEWATAGDDRVCPDCEAMEGDVFDLDDIENRIPLHPQCRCVALPVQTEANEEEARRTREDRDRRIREREEAA